LSHDGIPATRGQGQPSQARNMIPAKEAAQGKRFETRIRKVYTKSYFFFPHRFAAALAAIRVRFRGDTLAFGECRLHSACRPINGSHRSSDLSTCGLPGRPSTQPKDLSASQPSSVSAQIDSRSRADPLQSRDEMKQKSARRPIVRRRRAAACAVAAESTIGGDAAQIETAVRPGRLRVPG
jgi:hypothetical protein